MGKSIYYSHKAIPEVTIGDSIPDLICKDSDNGTGSG